MLYVVSAAPCRLVSIIAHLVSWLSFVGGDWTRVVFCFVVFCFLRVLEFGFCIFMYCFVCQHSSSEDHLQNDIDRVGWGVKLYSNSSYASASVFAFAVLLYILLALRTRMNAVIMYPRIMCNVYKILLKGVANCACSLRLHWLWAKSASCFDINVFAHLINCQVHPLPVAKEFSFVS